MTYKRSPLWLAATAALAMCPAPGGAQVLANGTSDVVQVSLMPGWREADGTHKAALRITLAPGWKTYWRAPGDGGIPTRFDFSKSGNLDAARVLWPTPEVFRQNGLRSIGYRGDVIVPIELAPTQPGGDIDLYAHMDFGVCEEICLPVHLRLDHSFAASEAANMDVINAAFADRPVPGEQANLGAVECQISYSDGQAEFVATLDLPAPEGRGEAMVIEPSDPMIWVSEPTLTRDGDTLVARATMASPSGDGFSLDLSQTRMTVLTTQTGIDIQGC